MSIKETIVIRCVSPLEQMHHRGGLPFGLSQSEEKVALKLLRDGMNYVKNNKFYHQTAEQRLFETEVDVLETERVWNNIYTSCNIKGADIKASRSDKFILTKTEEYNLFLQFNYARYRVARIIKRHRKRDDWTLAEIRGMVTWYNKAMSLKSDIVVWNLGLIPTVAKYINLFSDPLKEEIFLEGEICLIRSVGTFDVNRGFKFSTYAWRAILSGFISKRTRLRKTEQKKHEYNEEKVVEFFKSIREKPEEPLWIKMDGIIAVLQNGTANLDKNEKIVLIYRFFKNMSLLNCGRKINLTKERTRQIQIKALQKIRNALNGNIEDNFPKDQNVEVNQLK